MTCIPPEVIDLARPGVTDKKVAREDAQKWGINNLDRFYANGADNPHAARARHDPESWSGRSGDSFDTPLAQHTGRPSNPAGGSRKIREAGLDVAGGAVGLHRESFLVRRITPCDTRCEPSTEDSMPSVYSST